MLVDVPYFNILVEGDQNKYLELRKSLTSENMRYQRNRRVDTFDTILEKIHEFCIRGDEDDWKRCMVCGVCWLNGLLAINVKQLEILTDKSKSNINGVLAKLGYSQAQNGVHKKQLIDALPFLKGNYLEQRFWTIRVRPSYCHSPESSSGSEMASSPEIQYSKTPQPTYHFDLIEPPCSRDLKNLFNVIDMKIFDGMVCGESPNEIDFFADPTCCCPAEWINPMTPAQTLLSFA
ncbi:hypothetical protein TVAG_056050 [Trichomonas vaginalis G3]|uniref:Initiator binding domain-containing protein n=1 Tax=Trichomonas vaginalis (strain ATCC PRA-98 / G3) TaxID=412133 RepID=A2EL58_TRIV3|nr:transcription-initiator DNA-binding domain ibd family [Trichomonas vaginalis G3]EAY06611.1 hypothetical protein TVAG_056050 [Trichomonas vaginalis G3]KAI5551653.1 transcription-initiator DNA-binding domain ibd family [Trichomonas vaginalis G3]|eukprot:XP_001318834.1 hypothetical protein [Trichomonas vaginalis G3]